MNTAPIIVERVFLASPERVWKALTDKEEMKHWYFELESFKTEPGFRFEFYEPGGKKKFLHRCEIKEVIPNRKLSYTWSYPMDPAVTLVTFELFPEGKGTRLRLTHEGVDQFSPLNTDLARKNFIEGWNEIIGKNLPEYLEKS